MRVRVWPGVPTGTVTPPCSKSQAHRAFFCGISAGGVIDNVDISEDIAATIDACRAFGAIINIDGRHAAVTPGGTPGGDIVIDCRESGSTLRFAIPYALTLDKNVTFTGRGRLMERPLECYRLLCEKMGWDFRLDGAKLTVRGDMGPGRYELEQVESSQFVSGMMMALGALKGRSEIAYGSSPSRPYINMTARMMERFGQKCRRGAGSVAVGGGYSPCRVFIEGDWSQGAVWRCLGAMRGDIGCLGLDMAGSQGDRVIEGYLAQIDRGEWDNNGVAVFRSLDFDCTDHPDLAPMAAACACLGDGVTRLKGAGRLEQKESDRAAGIIYIINSLGGQAERQGDEILVYPIRPKGGVTISSRGDHRMAMMAAVLACVGDRPVEIERAEAVGKSYPDFWDDLHSLGIRVDIL